MLLFPCSLKLTICTRTYARTHSCGQDLHDLLRSMYLLLPLGSSRRVESGRTTLSKANTILVRYFRWMLCTHPMHGRGCCKLKGGADCCLNKEQPCPNRRDRLLPRFDHWSLHCSREDTRDPRSLGSIPHVGKNWDAQSGFVIWLDVTSGDLVCEQMDMPGFPCSMV